MRKLVAVLAVFAAVLAPSLHLWCEGRCDEPAAMTTSACHHQPSSNTALSTAHNCATHDQSPALVAKPQTPPAPILSALAIVPASVSTTQLVGLVPASTSDPPKDPPPIVPTPLRL